MGEGAAAREDHSLLSALSGRRIAGTSDNAGPISHLGAKKPALPSAPEEAVLIASSRLARFSMDPTPRMKIPSVAARSSGNAQAAHGFLVNDEGTWLLHYQRACEVLAWMKECRPNRGQRTRRWSTTRTCESPPYVQSMNDAVDQVAAGDQFVRTAARHGKETVQNVKDVCHYIYDTDGRFPSCVNAFQLPGVWPKTGISPGS